ncbi:winged helix DNA-binding domain-containing protein [Saxibacter everestensis]|uniref:Winged helix DNA-binding domain-containing protein n=1 Tax=Saxibacter everestensis TaxID=2909229 RepID=A0ABY8QWK5_9MICO|nr:winged helix DNA-binding domain-containing protein [Brevibacteriaceae bacterium ZFBP1038]
MSLSLRELNRATLARQSLLSRGTMSPIELIEHLVGLQAQAPLAPYFALWTRLKSFQPDELAQLLLDRKALRMVLMRGTIHLVSADDALTFRPLTKVITERDLVRNATHAPALAGLDFDELAATGRRLVEERPLSISELRPLLQPIWPDRDPASLAYGVRNMLPFVQVPPRAIWGRSGQPRGTTLEHWLGRDPHPAPSIDDMVLRYLGAYGPASVMDAQQWSGLTRLTEVFQRLRPSVLPFTGPDGAELFDLPDAPRPAADVPAPVRLLAPFDNVLLSHAARERIIDLDMQKLVFTINGIIKSTVLVNGFVVGIVETVKKKDEARAVVTLFHQVSKRASEQIEREALKLLSFDAPGTRQTVELLRSTP